MPNAHGGQTTERVTRCVVGVDLGPFANNIALTTPQNLHHGSMNVWGNSLPTAILEAAACNSRVPFDVLPADGVRYDNVRCEGQFVHLPVQQADWIHVLAASERRCEEEVFVHYASGAVDTEWLRVSDFWHAEAHFGEQLVVRKWPMHYPHHRQLNLAGQIWGVRVPVTRGEPLSAVRLPDNPALHIFALSLESVHVLQG